MNNRYETYLFVRVPFDLSSEGTNTAGKAMVVPWRKQPKLTAETAKIWVNLRGSRGLK